MKGAAEIANELPVSRAEMLALSKKCGQAVADFVRYYVERVGQSPAEARESARLTPEDLERYAVLKPHEISWITLGQLAEAGKDGNIYYQIFRSASAELDSGQRAADAVIPPYDSSPYQHARFTVLRQALQREWSPSPGSESSLVDMLAQIQTLWEHWLCRHAFQASIEPIEPQTGWQPSRISEAEALELSVQMVDRYNKMFLRTLRALRELKRGTGQVVVQSASQVNVGAQQLNVQGTNGT